MKVKILIMLCFLIFLVFGQKFSENFNSEEELPYNIWMYWENRKGKRKPEYLNLCYKTILKHNKKFNIHLLDEKSVFRFLPDLRKDLDKYMNIPQKADYIRINLLHKYGGIWIDSDTIVIKDLSPFIEKLRKYEFVGFGCTGPDCDTLSSGYPRPSNWLLVSRKNSLVMSKCLEEANNIIKHSPYIFRIKYHIIGRMLLWDVIQKLKKTGWDYLHMPSKCVEQDSKGFKYINNRLISNEDYDKKCKDKLFFIPIYNTAPGFPEWFRSMTQKEILENDMLISKLFKLSLK